MASLAKSRYVTLRYVTCPIVSVISHVRLKRNSQALPLPPHGATSKRLIFLSLYKRVQYFSITCNPPLFIWVFSISNFFSLLEYYTFPAFDFTLATFSSRRVRVMRYFVGDVGFFPPFSPFLFRATIIFY